ncbi:HAD family hydrolase [Planococcus sp. X10-3]|uniref:HAD family hydrolase n=1 Tax=Planococcus sp. X10-3 TaxID=3061240 RepID=UPI003BAF0A2D
MDSIIFDLDGTIWDPVDTVLAAWNSILKKHEIAELSRKDLEKTMGLQMDEISRQLFPDMNDAQRQKLIAECTQLENASLEKQGGRLYGDADRVFKELFKKYKLYIVSNCQDGYIEAFYKYHNLEKYIEDYENPGRTGLSKGENINLVIKRNHLSAPVYIGDTEGDLKAARFAGIPFVYAKYGFGQVSGFEKAVDSFEDLLTIF